MAVIFRASTKEASVIKTLGEYYSNSLKNTPLFINEKGIFSSASDSVKHILNELELDAEAFTKFICKKPLRFTMNSANFYKMLKSIKKRDSLTLFIRDSLPSELNVRIEQEHNKVTTAIPIVYNQQPEEIDLPKGYEKFLSVVNKEYQGIKVLQGTKEMLVSITDTKATFYSDGNKTLKKEVLIGDDEDDLDEKKSKDEKIVNYSQQFVSNYLTHLTKCAGQSPGTIQIYYDDDLPLLIKLKVGSIGKLKVYIKSQEIIKSEEDSKEENEEEEENEENNNDEEDE